MGNIVKRVNPSGAVVYRAQIRIKREGMPPLSESKTFSKRALAVEWMKKRELEIEAHPEIIEQGRRKKIPTLKEAAQKYIDEHAQMGHSKKMGLLFLSSFPIGKRHIDKLRRDDYSMHIKMRRDGMPEMGIKPIAASTALQELQYIRTLLKHAFYVWDMPVSWQELDFAAEGLASAKIVTKSKRRDRLPTSEELQALTNHFYSRWRDKRHVNHTPMHLIMWLAIYTCRREGELARMMLADRREQTHEWLIRDVKHPGGSEGNHKWFDVRPEALPVIEALLDPVTRKRMLACTGERDSLIPISAETISTAFTRGCKVLGIEDLRFHDLRHEGATRLAEDGLTVPQIQMVTLHNSWSSLQRYVNMRKRPDRLHFQAAMAEAERVYQSALSR